MSWNYQGNCDNRFCVKHRGCLVHLHYKGGVDFFNLQEEQELWSKQEFSGSDRNTTRSQDSQLPIPEPTVQIHYSLMVSSGLCYTFIAFWPPIIYVQNQPGNRPWSPRLKHIFTLGIFRRNVDTSPSFTYPFSNAMFCYKVSKCRSKQEILNSWWKLGNDGFCCCFKVVLSHIFVVGLSWTNPVTSPEIFLDTVIIYSILSNLNDMYRNTQNSPTDMAVTVHICQSLIFSILFPMTTLRGKAKFKSTWLCS